MRTDLLALGVFGARSRLRERIEALFRGSRATRHGAVGLAGCLLAGATLGAISAPRWIAFAQQPAFEVASIKPGDPNDGFFFFGSGKGLFTATNVTLKQLVNFAYDLRDYEISGGPKWLGADRYSIEAKPDSATPILPGPAGRPAMRAMLQQLLAERFKLVVHHEMKGGQVYELVVARGGSKLKDADPTRSGRTGVGSTGPGNLQGMAGSMGGLAGLLALG